MDDYRSALIVSAMILIMCSTLSVGFRLCRSFYVLGKLSWHDGFIILAAICAIIMSVDFSLLTTAGLGLHDIDGTIMRSASFQKSLVVINVFYLLCNMFVKTALLLMYRQFTMEWYFHWLINAMHVATILFGVSSVFAIIFQCLPISGLWDPTVHPKCISIPTFYFANAGIMIGMDFVLYIMPILFTWNIQLHRAQKLGLRFLFGLGFLVVVSSCVRLWVINDVLKHGDIPYNYAHSLIASAVENHLAICIACAPAIRAMLSRFLKPRLKDVYCSSRDRLSHMPIVISPVPPNSPRQSFSVPTTRRSIASTFHQKFYSSAIGPFAWTVKRPSTTATTITTARRDPDLESIGYDFESQIPNPFPTIHTLIPQGPNPRPSTSEKQEDKIYVKHEISTRETFLRNKTPSQMSWRDDMDIDFEFDETSGVDSTSGILMVPPLAYFENERNERSCFCECHPDRVVSPAHLCGWCTADCS